MAQAAPGLAPERNEPPCYNCGIRGHMFTACPEEPRKVPAGLEASWARQQPSNSPHNDHVTSKRGKGPVITRYPPPPPLPPPPAPSHHPPPMSRFENSPPQSYHPGPVPGYPPQSLYGPGHGGHPPPPNTSYDRFGPPPPGLPQSLNAPPYHNAYGATYGPQGPVHGPYDHQAPPPGRPGQYFPNDYPPGPPNRPTQYPPNQYPPGPPYGAPPQYPPGPPQYPPPPNFVPPPAPYGYHGPPPGYPQGGYSPPQQGPPPPVYPPYPPPPVDPSHGQPYGDDRHRHQRGRDQHRYGDRRSNDAWHSQDGWHNVQLPDDQPRDYYQRDWHDKPSYHEERGSRRWGHGRPSDERRRERHDRFHPYKNSDRSDRQSRWRQQPAVTSGRTTPHRRNSLDRETPITIKTDQDREPGEIVSEPTSASVHGDADTAADTIINQGDEEFDWDERTIFLEPPSSGKVDPIAAPLPALYSEDVMIPPAFDAKALKSRYITPRNVDDFAQSVRETRDWHFVQYHPAFLDITEIHPGKLDDYEKASRDASMRNNRRDRSNNSHDVSKHRYGNSKGLGRHYGKNQEHRYKPDQKKRRWDEFHSNGNNSGVDNRSRSFPYHDSHNKRIKTTSPEPGEVIESGQETPYEPSNPPAISIDDQKPAAKPDDIHNSKPSSPSAHYGSDGLNQGTRSQRPNSLSVDDQNRLNAQSPVPHEEPARSPRSYSRPPSRQNNGSIHKGRSSSRRSSFGSKVSEPPGSPLDSIERELLGLERPPSSGSNAEEDSPKRRFKDATPKFKRRQPMLDAYSRRW